MAADLDMTVVGFSPPSQITGCQRTEISFAVKNIGTDENGIPFSVPCGQNTCASWVDAVSASADGNVSGTRFGTSGSNGTDENFKPGDIYISSGLIYLDPTDVPFIGTGFLIAIANNNSFIFEAFLDPPENNTLASPVTFVFPDLTVTEFNTTTAVSPGGSYSVFYRIINDGNAEASTGPGLRFWHDRLFLSTDENLDSGDIQLNFSLAGFSSGTLNGVVHKNSLEPGEDLVVEAAFEMPMVEPGNYYLLLSSDADEDIICEFDHDNQIVSFPIEVQWSDLTINGFGYPNSRNENFIYFDGSIANYGLGVAQTASPSDYSCEAAEDWRIGLYLSRDDVLDSSDISVTNGIVDVNFADENRTLAADEKVDFYAEFDKSELSGIRNGFVLLKLDDPAPNPFLNNDPVACNPLSPTYGNVPEVDESNNMIAAPFGICKLEPGELPGVADLLPENAPRCHFTFGATPKSGCLLREDRNGDGGEDCLFVKVTDSQGDSIESWCESSGSIPGRFGTGYGYNFLYRPNGGFDVSVGRCIYDFGGNGAAVQFKKNPHGEQPLADCFLQTMVKNVDCRSPEKCEEGNHDPGNDGIDWDTYSWDAKFPYQTRRLHERSDDGPRNSSNNNYVFDPDYTYYEFFTSEGSYRQGFSFPVQSENQSQTSPLDNSLIKQALLNSPKFDRDTVSYLINLLSTEELEGLEGANMGPSGYLWCDIDRNNQCNELDRQEFQRAANAERGEPDFLTYLDINGDFDINDLDWLALVILTADLNEDGTVNNADVSLANDLTGICESDTSFESDLDFDNDGCITSTDQQIWTEYYVELNNSIFSNNFEN